MDSMAETLTYQFMGQIRELGFFDACCWLGRPLEKQPFYPETLEELKGFMNRAGVARALISHTLARYSHPVVGNRLLAESLQGERRFTGCFVLLPPATGELGGLEVYVDDMLDRGARAARLFPASHNYSLAEWSAKKLLDLLESRRIPLLLWRRECGWDALREVCAAHPGLPVILEQCGEEAYWNLRCLIPLMESCPNLHLETDKAHLYLGLDELVRRFGSGRFIYGSYYPVDDPYASLMLVTGGDFSREDKERIAGGNLERLLEGVR
jgi:hypothetical protein